jgi:hypothetical protein
VQRVAATRAAEAITETNGITMNSSVSRRAPALRALVGISMLALSGVAMKIKQSRGLRMQKFGIVLQAALSLAFFVCVEAHAQGVQPYPNAITTREVRSKSPMLPPPVNIVFTDPDFGSEMVRVTDENMDSSGSREYFVNPGGLIGAWSADGQKFYVVLGAGAVDSHSVLTQQTCPSNLCRERREEKVYQFPFDGPHLAL